MLKTLRSVVAYLNTKGFFDLLFANFLVKFLGFGTVLLVAKFVTPTEMGEIKIIQSYSSIFLILAGFGFDTAVLKVCSERSSIEEKEGVLRLSLKRSLITSLSGYILLIVLSLTGIIASSIHIAKWLVIYSITIPIMVITQLLMAFLQAQKKIKVMAKIQALIKIQSAIIITVCTWKWGLEGFVFSTIAAIAIGLIPLLWQVGLRFTEIRVKNISLRLSKYAFFSMLANFVSQIGQRGDILILDRFLVDREAVGYYSLATVFLMAAIQVTGVVQQIVTPYFSENAADSSWVVRRLKENILRMIGLSICVAVSVYFSAWVVIRVFFAPQYRVVLLYLPILLLKYIIFSSYSLVGASLVGLGFMRFNFAVVAISTPLTLLLLYFGQKHYGIIGIAWSTVLAAIITAILSFASLRMILKRHY